MPLPYNASVVIYTTRYCGYCHAAKRLLDGLDVAYREIPADDRADLRNWLIDASQQHTVPQVFINGVPIGGYSELAALERSGKLPEWLAQTPPDDAEELPS